jgi:putative component of membrane protein insertase Oxa1/YidC/SpoIIIJ protein YidD
MKQIKKVAADVIFFAIQFVKRIFCIPSGTCRHVPSCSQFIKTAIVELPLLEALQRIFGRLIRCHPLGTSGYDPVIIDNNSKDFK